MAQRSPSRWIWAAVHWTCSCYQENSTVPWVPSAWSAWRWSCWWLCHCWQLPFWGLWRRFWMIFGCCDVSFFFWVSFVLEGFRFVINWIFQVGPSVPKKRRTWNPLQLVLFSRLPGVFAPRLLDEGPLLSGHRLPVPLPPRWCSLCDRTRGWAKGQPLGASEMMSRQEQVDKKTSIQHLWTQHVHYT